MKIYCESCGSEIPAANINLQDRVAKCESCNNIFSISKLLDGIAPPRQSPQDSGNYSQKREVPLPKGITVEQDYEGLKITRRWFNLSAIFLTFFCLIWDGSIVMLFIFSISSGTYVMALAGSIHAIAGVCLTYWCIALYLNKTTITVSSYLIKVLHSPLPFPGSKEFPIDQLNQVFIKERVKTSRSSGSYAASSQYYSYDVYILDKNNSETKIVSNLNDKSQALYIEQEIEKYLDIEDQYVPGSVTG